MKLELRVQDAELRANEDGTMTVSGYVNKTGQRSNVLGVTKKFVEKIAAGAFQRAILNRERDIDFLAEHDNKKILASTRNSSLELSEDETGLFMSATIAPTSWGKDYYALIQTGILRNMSFGFRSVKDSWRAISPGLFERTIEELELFEVSVVRDPAYSQSTIAARGIDLVEDVEVPQAVEEENRQMEKMQEMIKALEERVNDLATEVQELRSVKEEVEEVREEPTPEPEIVEEQPVVEEVQEEVKQEETPIEEAPTEEQPTEEAQEQVEEKIEEPTEEVVEEEVSEEKSEDSEPSEEEVSQEEQVEEEEKVEEEDRSVDVASELAELRNRLAALK